MASRIVRAIGFVLLCEFIGLIGTVFTLKSIADWYPNLVKPSFTPPSWLFGPVWIILYALMGIAVYFVWSKGMKSRGVRLGLVLFSVQLALNLIWSVLFFGLRSILGGLIDIILLWITILMTIVAFYKVSRKAALAMVPYLAWVTIALLLNFYVWKFNK